MWLSRLMKVCPPAVLLVFALLLPTGAAAQDKPRIEVMPNLRHAESVNSVAFSPDGRQILSGSSDKTLKLWDVASGKLLRTLEKHSASILSVAFSPDGQRALSGSGDKTVKIWDVETGKVLLSFNAVPDPGSKVVNDVAFSPDRRQFLSCNEGSLGLFDAATGRLLRVLGDDTAECSSAAFSPDGRQVLSRSYDTLTLWDVATGKASVTIKGDYKDFTSVVFSPDGRSFLTGGNNTLKFWEVASGHLLRTIQTAASDVNSVAFSPDGGLVVSGNSGHSVDLWDATSGNLLRTFEHPTSVGLVAFSPDGNQVLSADNDSVLRLWDTATGKLVRTIEGDSARVLTVAFSPNDRQVLSGGEDKTLRLWDTVTGKLLRAFEGHSDNVLSVAFSPDGLYVLSGSQDKTLKLWDAVTGKLVRSFEGHSEPVWSVAFSPDGRRVLSGSQDKTIKLWDATTGRLLQQFQGHSGPLFSVSFSPDGRRVLSGSFDGTLKLWDIRTNRLLRTFKGQREESGMFSFIGDAIRTAAFSPDGRRMLSSNLRGTINVRDVASGKLSLAIKTRSEDGRSVAFSPDGRQLLSGGGDGKLKLWNAFTGELLREFKDSLDPVNSAAFSHNSRWIVSGSGNGAVQIWDVATGEAIVSLFGGRDSQWLALTPAGFFDASERGADTLHIVRGLNVTPIDQVFEHLYRPDLVEYLLKGDREGHYKNAAHGLNLDTILGSGPPPQIEHLPEQDNRAGDSFRLSVRITGRGGGVGNRIVWQINGVTQGDPHPAELAGPSSPLASVVVAETLKLAPGQTNTVKVTAYNSAGLIASSPLSITIDNVGATTTVRPRMFVLAIGIDKYRMKEYRLSYAAYDAKSFASALQITGSGLFSDVQAKTLTDEEVSEAGISAAISGIAGVARPDDVFVLFLSGHGRSIEGRYYYYPQTLDFAAGHTVEGQGIGQDKWETLLAKITVQKSLLIIDTCEGDAFRGARGTDTARQTAMAQLQRSTGRNVIAASRDAAYEGYRGHGVLTYALLEALDKGTTTSGDDRVRVTTLAAYVGVRVPEISQQAFGIYQNPTRKLAGNDFPIGIRQPSLAAIQDGPEISREPTHVLIREEVLRERPAADAPGSRALAQGFQVRAVEFVGAWVIVARDGQRLGYVQASALARLQ